jgi:hypothetical protein
MIERYKEYIINGLISGTKIIEITYPDEELSRLLIETPIVAHSAYFDYEPLHERGFWRISLAQYDEHPLRQFYDDILLTLRDTYGLRDDNSMVDSVLSEYSLYIDRLLDENT